MAAAALVVSIVALFVGLYAARVAREVAESGFKAEEQFKADLVILLAALRSLIVKGILSGQDANARSVEKEIDTLRSFQASTSGLALATWAATQGARGGSEDVAAGRWRTLSLNLGNLCGATGESSEKLQSWATAVELTLEDLTEDSVRAMSKDIGNLPQTFAALKKSREDDILMRAWFAVYQRREEENRPEFQRRRLEHLIESGVDDPDVDMWLALISHDQAGFKSAVARGGNRGAGLAEVLARHENGGGTAAADLPPSQPEHPLQERA